ncbi:Histone H4 acetyltransferase, NuA4 complex, Eaf6 protein [Pseudoloma neurophilia]|uniref:Chromatin modification-related protein EAF6 n=1 Tax=Pseudoloma neurophilia TaxID=146866 RepID=A0A0R0LXF6_9MICR|nr:Histone H4 acetyltransferase, NuA4 complex, Eaf6 protein [Pseudoloma neurophilia]
MSRWPNKSKRSKIPKQKLLTISTRLNELLTRRTQLLKEKSELEKNIYKLETEYLELGQGNPITTSLDAYLGTRGEKKKYVVNAKDRLFSTLLPRVYRDGSND